jgi:hypothetical protein
MDLVFERLETPEGSNYSCIWSGLVWFGLVWSGLFAAECVRQATHSENPSPSHVFKNALRECLNFYYFGIVQASCFLIILKYFIK